MVKRRFCCKPKDKALGGLWPVLDRTTGALEYYAFRSQQRRACAIMNGKVTLPDPTQHITNQEAAA